MRTIITLAIMVFVVAGLATTAFSSDNSIMQTLRNEVEKHGGSYMGVKNLSDQELRDELARREADKNDRLKKLEGQIVNTDAAKKAAGQIMDKANIVANDLGKDVKAGAQNVYDWAKCKVEKGKNEIVIPNVFK